MKDFLKVQYEFFKSVAVMYLAPVKVVVAFLAILWEMFLQMTLCLSMNSDEYKKLQDMRFAIEARGEIIEDDDEESEEDNG